MLEVKKFFFITRAISMFVSAAFGQISKSDPEQFRKQFRKQIGLSSSVSISENQDVFPNLKRKRPLSAVGVENADDNDLLGQPVAFGLAERVNANALSRR